MHPLLQFSTQAEKVLKKIENENNISLKLIGGKGESSCHMLVGGVSKLMFKNCVGDPGSLPGYSLKNTTSKFRWSFSRAIDLMFYFIMLQIFEWYATS